MTSQRRRRGCVPTFPERSGVRYSPERGRAPLKSVIVDKTIGWATKNKFRRQKNYILHLNDPQKRGTLANKAGQVRVKVNPQ